MKKKVKFYDCLKKFVFLSSDISNIRKVSRMRNQNKIIKLYQNGKFKGYLKMGKLSRNLHIETKDNGEINLFTDY